MRSARQPGCRRYLRRKHDDFLVHDHKRRYEVHSEQRHVGRQFVIVRDGGGYLGQRCREHLSTRCGRRQAGGARWSQGNDQGNGGAEQLQHFDDDVQGRELQPIEHDRLGLERRERAEAEGRYGHDGIGYLPIAEYLVSSVRKEAGCRAGLISSLIPSRLRPRHQAQAGRREYLISISWDAVGLPSYDRQITSQSGTQSAPWMRRDDTRTA
jgi:hypothetical protein